ncbi:hypothetical protein NMG60_11035534 [Bertholletia excelsa]
MAKASRHNTKKGPRPPPSRSSPITECRLSLEH